MSEDEQDALLAKMEKRRRQRSLLFRASIGAAIVAAIIALALNSGVVAWH